MRTFIVLLIVVVVGLAGWFWVFNDGNQIALNTPTPTFQPGITRSPSATTTASPVITPVPTASPVSTPVPGTGGGEDVDFIRRGVLLRNGAGMVPDVLYLSYGIGVNTYLAELTFPPDAECLIQGVADLCSSVELTPGMFVRIHGFFEMNEVEVVRLEVLVAAVSPSPTISPTLSPSPTTTPTPALSPTVSPAASVFY